MTKKTVTPKTPRFPKPTGRIGKLADTIKPVVEEAKVEEVPENEKKEFPPIPKGDSRYVKLDLLDSGKVHIDIHNMTGFDALIIMKGAYSYISNQIKETMDKGIDGKEGTADSTSRGDS